MPQEPLARKAERYLQHLCREIPNRRVGTAGNRAATDFFAETMGSIGFETSMPAFDCLDWQTQRADLRVGEDPYEVLVSPYSSGCQVAGPLAVAGSLSELEALEASGRVVLLLGELTREQLMPKNFPFYNPDAHQRILRLLERKAPLAIVTATGKDPGMAGGMSPFPLIEDGDFDLPSVYMTLEEGTRLAERAGETARLEVRAQRRPARGCNVIARLGNDPPRRVVVCAHIDAKDGTPGAIDNASGVTVLLLLAELLAGYRGRLGIELVALNGEDYYSAPGERLFLEQNHGRWEEIVVGINIDGAGYLHGQTAYSLYDCEPELSGLIRQVFSGQDSMLEGERWYQSDHSLFLLHGRPAVALTSERFAEIWSRYAHTPQDLPEIVDPGRLVALARALRELLLALDSRLA